VAGISSYEKNFYLSLTGKNEVVTLFAQTYNLLEHSAAALVTSGTATLETALFGVPQVVCYKGGIISYHIAKLLVKVDYISLVNLIMGKEVVKELIQNNFNEENLKSELNKILNHTDYRNKMIAQLCELKNKLGGTGASARTAELIMGYLSTIR
jgi:lipid-A-disaccharide synthase